VLSAAAAREEATRSHAVTKKLCVLLARDGVHAGSWEVFAAVTWLSSASSNAERAGRNM